MNKVFVILFLLNSYFLPGFSQPLPDSLALHVQDSLKRDSVRLAKITREKNSESTIIHENKLLQLSQPPVQLITVGRKSHGEEILFYLLASVTLLLGFLKIFYSKYFDNIFQVFFNTSLRQNQLTDLLLQAKLASLIFNVYFFITGGIYCYFLLQWNGMVSKENMVLVMLAATAGMGGIYLLKYCCLLFLGWLADMQEPANTYIFITFLVNKILGICLLPCIILIAFSMPGVVNVAVIISLMMVGLLFLSRYLRSYSLLQKDLRISVLHFFLYILAIEVIPLLIIYKAVLLALETKTNR